MPIESGIFSKVFRHGLDEKKRLTIPSEWRHSVGTPAKLMVMQSFDHRCLMAMPYQVMQARMARLQQISFTDARARKILRNLGQVSEVVGWDKQGRIRVDDQFLRYAGIENRVVLLGTYTGFELWDEQAYDEQEQAVDMSDLAGDLQELEINW